MTCVKIIGDDEMMDVPHSYIYFWLRLLYPHQISGCDFSCERSVVPVGSQMLGGSMKGVDMHEDHRR